MNGLFFGPGPSLIEMFFIGWTIEDGTFRLLSSDVGLALSLYLSIVILGLLLS